jgi:hypothetical protein
MYVGWVSFVERFLNPSSRFATLLGNLEEVERCGIIQTCIIMAGGHVGDEGPGTMGPGAGNSIPHLQRNEQSR